jgi:phosphonatase-like hydrolase
VSGAEPVTLLCCGLLGVAVDDGGILERAFTEAFATQGIVPGTAAYARSMVHVHQARGQSAVDVFRGVFPNAPGRAEAATLAFDRSYRLAVDRSGLAPMGGAAEALAEIRGAGIRVCFITGLSRGLVGLVLDALGWWRQVELVLCPEDSPRGYPWPDPMLSAMLRLGVDDVQATAYAGGTESGVLCGRRAGARIVAGVLTGGHTRDRLHRAGATHLLGSIVDLPGVLAEAAADRAAAAAGTGAAGAGAAGAAGAGAADAGKASSPAPTVPSPAGEPVVRGKGSGRGAPGGKPGRAGAAGGGTGAAVDGSGTAGDGRGTAGDGRGAGRAVPPPSTAPMMPPS